MPHLGGDAHCIRSAIVEALGAVLVYALVPGSPEDESLLTGDQIHARVRSKQHVLDALIARAADTSAFTRSRVMHTWAFVAERRSIPISHWNAVARLVLERMRDKAALVRRSAMQCAQTMLFHNPFGSQLHLATLEKTLKVYEERLAAAKEAK